MKKILPLVVVALCGFGFELCAQESAAAATAQAAPPPSAPAKLSSTELEKLLMPIALYPDALIATILPASVYPLEIVQAARFMEDTNNLAKLDAQPWDESIKALARIPAALKKMNENLQWTIQLGEVFLNQDKDVMDMIQALRTKAQQAGTLRTTEQQVVVVTNTIIQIESANPQVIYVPSYPYTVYYPPPAYVYNPYAPLVTFAAGVAVGAIIWNNCDWHHGGCYYGGGDVDVDVDIDRTVNRGDRVSNRPANGRGTQGKWQPDQSRLNRSGAGGPTASTRAARGWGSGGTRPSTGALPASRPATGARPATPGQQPSAASRPATGAGPGAASPWQQPSAGTRPTAGAGAGTGTRPASPWQQQPSAVSRPAQSPAGGYRPAQSPSAGTRPTQSPSFNRPSPQPASAFGGIGNGSSARSFSNRGSVSRGGGGRR